MCLCLVNLLQMWTLKDHEAFISNSYFVVGGIQSLRLSHTSEDSTYILEPGKEGSAKLLVPGGAIQGPDLHAGTPCSWMAHSPFQRTMTCQSSATYIDCDMSLVKKPLKLSLSHWYAGEDHQTTLTILKAPHAAGKDGLFPVAKHWHGSF